MLMEYFLFLCQDPFTTSGHRGSGACAASVGVYRFQNIMVLILCLYYSVVPVLSYNIFFYFSGCCHFPLKGNLS